MANWGNGFWGTEGWGDGEIALDPPSVYAVGVGTLDVLGGTILAVFGTKFTPPMYAEVIDMSGGDEVLGVANYFDPDLDLRPSKALLGMPPMPRGVYGIRAVTAGGPGNILRDVLVYEPVADRMKVERVKRRLAPVWGTGERITQ